MNYYFHFPFCRSKCGYCAFYSLPAPEPELVELWLGRIIRDLEELEPQGECETIYLGGGTPTLPECGVLERLFDAIRKTLKPGAETEISIEANPETLDRGKAALIRSFANRLSLGVQSFRPELRATLGRACSQPALERALELVREAEFPHWNCDLIYAVPGETRTVWREELRTVAQCGADHVSCYSLTPEEGARLTGELIPDEEEAAAMWRTAGEELGAAGILRYEISNYARPGCECRHNQNVWRGGMLRGFGPAAAGFDGASRMIEPADFKAWLRREPAEIDRIPAADRLNEIFAIQLRTAGGWTPELWRRVPGADSWETRRETARKAAAECGPGILKIAPGRIAATRRGMLFWNTLAEAIL